VAGYAAELPVPKSLRETIYGTFAKSYGVNLDECPQKLDEFETFADFFTRKIKARPITQDPLHFVSPADSRVLSFSEVKDDRVILVKDKKYKLGEFLTGLEGYKLTDELIAKAIKKKETSTEKTKLWHIIFYQAPYDYHRFHAPSDFHVKKRNHVRGYLYPVKVSAVTERPVLCH
jgi:phosphatidylserine decarboxylase